MLGKSRRLRGANAVMRYLKSAPPEGVAVDPSKLEAFTQALKRSDINQAHWALYGVLDDLDGTLRNRSWNQPEPKWDNDARGDIALLLVPHAHPHIQLETPDRKNLGLLPEDALHFEGPPSRWTLTWTRTRSSGTWSITKAPSEWLGRHVYLQALRAIGRRSLRRGSWL